MSLEKREAFAVSLRKEKRMSIIQEKREKIIRKKGFIDCFDALSLEKSAFDET